MQEKHGDSTAVDLREMLLNNTLDSESMSFEDYDKLFQYETKSDLPNGQVILFCSTFLSQRNKYSRDVKTVSFDELKQRLKKRNRESFNRAMFLSARMVTIIVVAVVLAAFTVQGVSMALGYDFFGFVRDWFFDSNTVGILISEPEDEIGVDLREIRTTTGTTSADEPPADEFVFFDFERLEDIDDEWLARISHGLIEAFEFAHSDFMRFGGDMVFNIRFVDDSGNDITLVIQNTPMRYVEREDEGFAEDVFANGVTFSVFNNIDDFQVIWEIDELFYQLNAMLTFEEVKEIITNWY
jgi:hypothetical protein